jgi:hypothetical protein
MSKILTATLSKNYDGTWQYSECDKSDYESLEEIEGEEIFVTVYNRPGNSVIIGNEEEGWAQMYWIAEWGGKRKGSGRPSTGRSKKVLYITDEEYIKVKQLIEQLRKPSE